jgi:hypothetical protein
MEGGRYYGKENLYQQREISSGKTGAAGFRGRKEP